MKITAEAERPSDAAVAVLADVEIVLPLAGLIDKKAEVARLRKQEADILKPLAGNQAKLANEAFVSRAPAEVVAQMRAKVAELLAQLEAIRKLLENLEAS